MSTHSLKEQGSKELTFLEHFEELRIRLLKSVIALAITTLLSFVFAQYLLRFIAVPIGGLEKLQSIEVTENIGVFMRVSLLSGVVLAMPVIVYQMLRFILPGLTTKEKRWVGIAVPSATVFFAGGVLFAYYIMLPPAIQFLTTFLGVHTAPRLSNYMNFVINLMFWIGVSFESPLIIFILAKLHIVTGKVLLKQWRIAIVVIAIIAAVITPTTDPVNMGLLMLPLIVLFFLSVLLAYLA
jgi:sec-independent protein translocase protein TatC